MAVGVSQCPAYSSALGLGSCLITMAPEQGSAVDDDVAEALYSPDRLYLRMRNPQITPLRTLQRTSLIRVTFRMAADLDGLASGLPVSLDIRTIMIRYWIHDQSPAWYV